MVEKNITYSLSGNEPAPTTIVPLYRSNYGAKVLNLKAEIWIPGFPFVPFPILDLEKTEDEQNAAILKDEFDNAQIVIYLFIRDLVDWHLLKFFSIVSRGAQQSPDILSPFKNSFGYFSLQKGYSLGIFIKFPQRALEDYEYISILGDIEESVLPGDEVVDDSPVPVPETLTLPVITSPLPSTPVPVPDGGTSDTVDLSLWESRFQAIEDALAALIERIDNIGVAGSDNDAAPPPTPTPVVDTEVVIEAETGEVTFPMEINSDPLASAGQFVLIPEGAGSSGELRISFQASASREYAIWGRVKAPDVRADSFYVQIDNLTPFLWDFYVSVNWSWQRIRTTDDQKVFALAEGDHRIKLTTREDGAAIDQLLITSDLGDAVNTPEPTPTSAIKPMEVGTFMERVPQGVIAAYSLRRLRQDYLGPALRVKREDLEELDIGFDLDGNLDTVALLSFVGDGDGKVVRLYDQAEQGYGALGTTNPATADFRLVGNNFDPYPRIVTDGVLVEKNQRPALSFFRGRSHLFSSQQIEISDNQTRHLIIVAANFPVPSSQKYDYICSLGGDPNPTYAVCSRIEQTGGTGLNYGIDWATGEFLSDGQYLIDVRYIQASTTQYLRINNGQLHSRTANIFTGPGGLAINSSFGNRVGLIRAGGSLSLEYSGEFLLQEIIISKEIKQDYIPNLAAYYGISV